MQGEPPIDDQPRGPSSLRFPLLVLLGFLVTVLVAALALPRGLPHRQAPSAKPAASQKR